MQKRAILFLLIILIVATGAAGCTSTETINATPVPTVTPQTPQIVHVNATLPETTSIPVAISTTAVTISATPTIEQPDETTLASFLTISGIGSNFVANATHYVPDYTGYNLYCNQYQNGTLFIFGSVNSRSKYSLNVDLEVNIISTQLSVDNSTLYDSIFIQPFGTAGYQFSTPSISYCNMVGGGNYDVFITGVSIAPTTQTE